MIVKDLIVSIAGIPTDSSSKLLTGYTRSWNSTLVDRFVQSGAVLVGKANTPELGMNASTEPVTNGPTRNPWNPDLTPGGSSGGSAAAVAAGLVPIAHANDGGGSTRIPAACTGLVGLKASRGRNPTGPDAGEIWSGLVGEHVVTRSVRDCAAMLDCTSGPDLGAPYCAPPPQRPYLEEAARDPRGLRIAFLDEAPTGDPVHPEYKRAVRETAKMLEELGHHVEWAAPRYDIAAYAQAFLVVMTTNCAVYMEDIGRSLNRMPGPENLEPINLWVLKDGRKHSGLDLLRAQQTIHSIRRQFAAFFESHSVLVTPALAMPPPPLGGKFASTTDPDELWTNMRSFAPFCHIYNGTGNPALTIPAIIGSDGLPTGIQLVAKYGDEGVLFQLAGQLERARPWKDRRPAIYA
jgi:amidase